MGAAGVGSEVQNQFGNEYLTIASVILTLLFYSSLKLFQRRWGQPIGASYLLQQDLFNNDYNCIVFHHSTDSVDEEILPSADGQLVTRDDLAALADLGEEEGALMEDEETVIHNLLRLREIPITEVMTPRVVVTTLQQDMTIRQVLDEYPVLPFLTNTGFFLNLSTKFKDWLSVLNYYLLLAEMNGVEVFQNS